MPQTRTPQLHAGHMVDMESAKRQRDQGDMAVIWGGAASDLVSCLENPALLWLISPQIPTEIAPK